MIMIETCLKWHIALWGKMPPGEEGGWEQKVTSGMGKNRQRLKVDEGAQEGGKYNRTKIRRE